MSNVLLQLLSYFLFKKRPITITLTITADNYNIVLFDVYWHVLKVSNNSNRIVKI